MGRRKKLNVRRKPCGRIYSEAQEENKPTPERIAERSKHGYWRDPKTGYLLGILELHQILSKEQCRAAIHFGNIYRMWTRLMSVPYRLPKAPMMWEQLPHCTGESGVDFSDDEIKEIKDKIAFMRDIFREVGNPGCESELVSILFEDNFQNNFFGLIVKDLRQSLDLIDKSLK